MENRKKCGLSAEDYGKECPEARKGRMPVNLRDCQGCQHGVII